MVNNRQNGSNQFFVCLSVYQQQATIAHSTLSTHDYDQRWDTTIFNHIKSRQLAIIIIKNNDFLMEEGVQQVVNHVFLWQEMHPTLCCFSWVQAIINLKLAPSKWLQMTLVGLRYLTLSSSSLTINRSPMSWKSIIISLSFLSPSYVNQVHYQQQNIQQLAGSMNS